ncbi:MAG TPA: hypothetical protein IAB03_01895 [Candidatus Gallibacteroides avistercoris]|uniref:Right-handed parallel beta-helix repeat-containing protein n=1 Tax=Candidatus Gallibacteroides avistercoris TaxID=2840833 RepID=A0A9D1M6P2_9BACT|nr:hypothetical protein [Candidatus Gallibacteroides avistercoris]
MKQHIFFLSALFLFCFSVKAETMKSIQEFGVLPQNTPQTNAENLQKAIDWASQSGAALWVEPTAEGYPVASGIVLKESVSLIGVHGPTGRGTKHPEKNAPTGSLFLISDEKAPFITVESATQIRGIQFWYPQQAYQDKDKIIPYPPTIQMSQDRTAQGVTLSCLTFYGEYIAMDFNGRPDNICEQILFEHCYGYPLSGEFIRIDYCYDIPRILHCHVNPSNMRMFGRAFSKEVVDAVIAQPTYTFSINHTDNAQLIDLFTFGAHGGIYLGEHTYGQLTNFNLDCVTVGIYKNGGGTFNRNWQIAQGSIIANVKGCDTEIHPIIITGEGHTAISNVEAFSGTNGALTAEGYSDDFLLITGDKPLTVSLYGCRMRNYRAENPLTIRNPQARVQAVACVDKEEQFFNTLINP